MLQPINDKNIQRAFNFSLELNRQSDNLDQAPYGLGDQRYIPLNGKEPVIKWGNKQYDLDSCLNLIRQGKANGIGYHLNGSRVIVIDCDGQEAIDYWFDIICKDYPAIKQLSYLATKSNTHKKDNSIAYWYIVPDQWLADLEIAANNNGKLIFDFGNNSEGKEIQLEIRFNKCYQVLQSIHPDTNKYYEIIRNGNGYLSNLPEKIFKNIIPCYQEFKGNKLDTTKNNANRELTEVITNLNGKFSLEVVKQILDLLPSDYYDNYDYWLRICAAIKNNNSCQDSFDLFLNFSKKSNKFQGKHDCLKVWDSIKRVEGSLASLRSIAKENNIKIKIDITYLIAQNKLDFIKSKILTSNYKFNSKGYLPEDIYTKFNPNDLLITLLKSGLGTGKSFALKKELKRLKQIKINLVTYVLSHRRSLENQNKGFGVPARSESLDSLTKDSGFSTCLDSLYQLYHLVKEAVACDKYIVLILDELSQIIDHLLKGTTEIRKHRQEIADVFKYIWNHASKIYGCDGNLCDSDIKRLADILDISEKELRQQSVIIENTYQNLTFKAYNYLSGEALIKKIKKDIERKLNTNNPYPIMLLTSGQQITTKKGTKNLYKLFQKYYPELKVLIIDSETSLDSDSNYFSLKQTYGNDWVNHLGNYDLVICSPTIETAISFDANNKFYGVYQFNLGNQKAENMFQFMCRVRDNCDRHYFIEKNTLNSNLFKDTNMTILRENYARQRTVNIKEYKRLLNTINTVEGNKLDSNSVNDLLKHNFQLADQYIHEDAANNSNLFNAFLETVLMDNLSYTSLNDNFEYLLTSNGCTIIYTKDISDNEKEFIKGEVIQVNEILVKEEINKEFNTPLVSKAECEHLETKKKQCNTLSSKKGEFLKINKYKESLFWGSNNTGTESNLTLDILYTQYKDKEFKNREITNYLCTLPSKLLGKYITNSIKNCQTDIDLVQAFKKNSVDKITLLVKLTHKFITNNKDNTELNKESNGVKKLIELLDTNREVINEVLRIKLPDLKEGNNSHRYIDLIKTILNLRGYTLKRSNKNNKDRKYKVDRLYSEVIPDNKLTAIHNWWKFRLTNNCYELPSIEIYNYVINNDSLASLIKSLFTGILSDIHSTFDNTLDTSKDRDALYSWWELHCAPAFKILEKLNSILNIKLEMGTVFYHCHNLVSKFTQLSNLWFRHGGNPYCDYILDF